MHRLPRCQNLRRLLQFLTKIRLSQREGRMFLSDYFAVQDRFHQVFAAVAQLQEEEGGTLPH